jgi:hypothetical protein
MFLLAMVVVGLFTEQLNRWTYALVLGGAVMTTALYYGMQRFWQ